MQCPLSRCRVLSMDHREPLFKQSSLANNLSRASQLLERGTAADVISLAEGDPMLPTPVDICAALADAVRSGFTHYAPAYGDHDLRAALAEFVSFTSSLPYEPKQVIVTHGASAALSAVVMATVEPGKVLSCRSPPIRYSPTQLSSPGDAQSSCHSDQTFTLTST